MSDAKSRYEIVESLTAQRQTVVDETTRLKEEVRKHEDSVEQLGRDHVRQVDDLGRKQTRELEDLKAAVTSFKDGAGIRQTDLQSKEKALKEAIDALKAISDSVITTKKADSKPA